MFFIVAIRSLLSKSIVSIISLQNYTMIQLTALKEKFKGKLKQNFPQIFIRKYNQQVSHPENYTEIAKIHKIDTSRKVEDLPITPTVSNIGTATYHLAKYLAQLLKPFSESQYTVKNTKEFIKKNRKQKIPKDYTMVSFDVVSLLTNVSSIVN